MADRLTRCGTAVLIAALLGCAPRATLVREGPRCCPACKERVVHRASLRGRVPAHTHVKYICPKCCRGWEGDAAPGAREVCPKCKRTLGECPRCQGKGAAGPGHDG